MLRGTSSPRQITISPESKRNQLLMPLPYDAPEKKFVNQKDVDINLDIWSLGVALYEYILAIDDNETDFTQLRYLKYEERVE